VPTTRVVVVSTLDSLTALRTALEKGFDDDDAAGLRRVVGLDVEWRPRHRVAVDGRHCVWPASILQLSQRTSVYVVDLLLLFAEWSSSDAHAAAVDAGLSASVGWLLTTYAHAVVHSSMRVRESCQCVGL
jgi:hypothetical protein